MSAQWTWLLLASLVPPATAQAATWLVDPAGGGDYLTIQEAIDNASTRDTLLLAAGEHDAGEFGISLQGDHNAASLVIMGQGSADDTVVRGSGSSTTIRCSYTTPETVIANVTIEDTTSVQGAGNAVAITGAAVLMNCVIRGQYGANGIVCEAAEGYVSILDCAVDVPRAAYGLNVSSNSTAHVKRSSFSASYACVYMSNAGGVIDSCVLGPGDRGLYHPGVPNLTVTNTRLTGSSAAAMEISRTTVEGCIFSQNGPTSELGMVEIGSEVRIANCTFVDNTVDGTNDIGKALIHIRGGALETSIVNNIFAYNDAVDLRTLNPDVEIACNLFWANDALSHLGIEELDPSNINADPLFCDISGGDYTLDAASPAAAEGSGGCGLLGALSVACGAPLHAPSADAAGLSLRVSPNPFNPVTLLRIAVDDTDESVDLGIYDIRGRRIRTLLNRERFTGSSLVWDGTDDLGRSVGNGVYFVKIASGGRDAIRRAVLVK